MDYVILGLQITWLCNIRAAD